MRAPSVPAPDDPAGWVRTPIDAFILARLQQQGLRPSPPADARTLIRRLYFDLLGLPPSPAEVDAFVRECEALDPKRGKAVPPSAVVAALIDRLLARPQYGERWARHWLDVARYADTTGYLPKGQKRYSYAWNYRDYVVRAFNEDLPYDRFLLEQLAADQLPARAVRPAPLEAMGFLTLNRVFLNNRHDIIDDRIDVVTRGLLGLTVTCARCHDHPHDPVPTADYYALYSVFANSVETISEPQSESVREEFLKERKALRAERGRLEADTSRAAEPEGLKRLAEIADRLSVLAWIDRPPQERTLALADVTRPETGHVFERGNPDAPGEPVTPHFLSALSAPGTPPFRQGSGRLELAQAIASPENPLVARVLVNRVWMHHFGHGLVRTPADFGVQGAAPTHPELLDWLAARFIADGWSLKKLHRLILASAVHRQGSVGMLERRSGDGSASAQYSTTPSLHRSLDPDNRLLGRMNRRRLDFESTRDALLAVAGRLDPAAGGPGVKLTEQPFATRRTLYGYLDRQDVPAWFRTFDFPAPDALCTRRFETAVPQRALFFLNSDFVLEQARQLAARAGSVGDEAGERAVFRLAYQRDPTAEELRDSRALMREAHRRPFSAPDWQYGFGEYDPVSETTVAFERLILYRDGAWRAGTDLPDKDRGFLSHNRAGGHPGRGAIQSFIRRWVAPMRGRVDIEGMLLHTFSEGDGIRGLIVSSRHGELGRWVLHNDEVRTAVSRVTVERGDVIDFVVEGGASSQFDHFLWAPVIRCTSSARPGFQGRVWDARRDFRESSDAWDGQPLTGLELLAHALLISNEFMFVD